MIVIPVCLSIAPLLSLHLAQRSAVKPGRPTHSHSRTLHVLFLRSPRRVEEQRSLLRNNSLLLMLTGTLVHSTSEATPHQHVHHLAWTSGHVESGPSSDRYLHPQEGDIRPAVTEALLSPNSHLLPPLVLFFTLHPLRRLSSAAVEMGP